MNFPRKALITARQVSRGQGDQHTQRHIAQIKQQRDVWLGTLKVRDLPGIGFGLMNLCAGCWLVLSPRPWNCLLLHLQEPAHFTYHWNSPKRAYYILQYYMDPILEASRCFPNFHSPKFDPKVLINLFRRHRFQIGFGRALIEELGLVRHPKRPMIWAFGEINISHQWRINHLRADKLMLDWPKLFGCQPALTHAFLFFSSVGRFERVKLFVLGCSTD